jgi:hypothetical protein
LMYSTINIITNTKPVTSSVSASTAGTFMGGGPEHRGGAAAPYTLNRMCRMSPSDTT